MKRSSALCLWPVLGLALVSCKTSSQHKSICTSIENLEQCKLELRRTASMGEFAEFEILFNQICKDKTLVCHRAREADPYNRENFKLRKAYDGLFYLTDPKGDKTVFFIGKKN